MEGQAEVATVDKETGKPLNGTLKYQLTDPRTAAEFAPCWDKATKNWTSLLPLGLGTFLRPFPLPQNRRSTTVAATIRRG